MAVLVEADLVAETSERELEELLGSSVDRSADEPTRLAQRQVRLDQALAAADEYLDRFLPVNTTTPSRSAVAPFALRFMRAQAIYWLRQTTRTRGIAPQDVELAEQRDRAMEQAADHGKLLFVDPTEERRARPTRVIAEDDDYLQGYSSRCRST